MESRSAAVAPNQMTSRWIEALPADEDWLISGYSAWVVLTALARGATGPAAVELAEACGAGLVPDDALERLLTATAADVSSAFGIWTAPHVPLLPDYLDELPSGEVGAIPGYPELDAWVSEATGDLITQFPRIVNEQTLLLVASALAVDTTWRQPFQDWLLKWSTEPRTQRGLKSPLLSVPTVHGLTLRSTTFTNAAVVEFEQHTIARFVCETNSDINVHVVSGDHGMGPTMRVALAGATGGAKVRQVDDLPDKASVRALTISQVAGRQDHLLVNIPKFAIDADHDLAKSPNIFGLSTALNSTQSHFEKISTTPLAVDVVQQVARAEFSAEGFRAAVVTAAAARMGAAMPAGTCRQVALTFDGPFGFLAVHRPTNLVLFAGWIATTEALAVR